MALCVCPNQTANLFENAIGVRSCSEAIAQDGTAEILVISAEAVTIVVVMITEMPATMTFGVSDGVSDAMSQ